MNKKFWIGFVVVYIVLNATNFIVHSGLLSSDYSSPEMMRLWRADMMDKMWIFYVTSAFTSFFFTFLFAKGYEGKGSMEGIRFGFYMGLLMTVPMAYASYAMYPIPYSVALKWFIYGMVQYLILGIFISLVYGMKPKQPAS